ncbi:MAG: hypothetical protein NTZ48_06320 [Candidatus Omnitrophica bacterium]|nr:hypothetical protein [Candidatus Omnitrophota bacterium]
MSLINKKAVKQFFHDKNRRISSEALFALESKIENILWGSIRIARNFKTITGVEINLAKDALSAKVTTDTQKGNKYCECKEPPIRLISHCRDCGLEIEKSPTIKEMLDQPEKEKIEELDLDKASQKDIFDKVNELVREVNKIRKLNQE